LNRLLRRLTVSMAVLLVSMILTILALILKNTGKPISPIRLGNRDNRELKAIIGQKCDRGRTILMKISGDLRPATVATLIAAGADLHEKDASGMTALKHAARKHDPGTVRVLIEAGADVNAEDAHKMTALMWACRVDFISIGLEPDARRAYINRMVETVRVLIEAGGDVNARDGYGHTPSYHASRFDLSEIDAFRLDPSLFPIEKYYQAALECLRLLEDAGAKDAAACREDFRKRNIDVRLSNLPLLQLWDESKATLNIALVFNREIGLPRLEEERYCLRLDFRSGEERIYHYESLTAALFDRTVIGKAMSLYYHPWSFWNKGKSEMVY